MDNYYCLFLKTLHFKMNFIHFSVINPNLIIIFIHYYYHHLVDLIIFIHFITLIIHIIKLLITLRFFTLHSQQLLSYYSNQIHVNLFSSYLHLFHYLHHFLFLLPWVFQISLIYYHSTFWTQEEYQICAYRFHKLNRKYQLYFVNFL